MACGVVLGRPENDTHRPLAPVARRRSVEPSAGLAAWLAAVPAGPVVTAGRELHGGHWVLVTQRHGGPRQEAQLPLTLQQHRTDEAEALGTGLQPTSTH